MQRKVLLAWSVALCCALGLALTLGYRAHAAREAARLAAERETAERKAAELATAELLETWLGGEDGGVEVEGALPRLRGGDATGSFAAVRPFYAAQGFRAAWLEDGRPTGQALALAKLLVAAADYGLRPGDYDAHAWQTRFAAAGLGSVQARAQLDLAFTAAVAHLVSDLRFGRVDPTGFGFASAGRDASEVAEILRHLPAAADVALALRTHAEPRHAAYALLLRELRRLRAAADSAPPSQIAQVELALERWRWLPHDLGERAIVVNVPEFRLRAYGASEAPELVMDVVVGDARGSATPLFTEAMRTVVFQPAWHVPASIVRGELVPSEQSDPGYLAARGYEVLDDAGRAVDGPLDDTVFARLREGSFAIRQRPGPGNALGRVKFLFPNRHNVYLHDTPTQAAFARERRDLSHGCVRVANPDALAKWVLRDAPGWSSERVRDALASRATLAVNLSSPIPVVLVYHTTVVDENGIRFLPDVYGHDATLQAALAERLVT